MTRGPVPDDDPASTEVRAPGPTGPAEASYRVVVVDGPDRGAAVTVSPSDDMEALVGQSPACKLVLRDATVSRRHVALEVVEGGLRLRDLGSTNGTFVERLRVIEALLVGGEEVRLGGTRLSVARVTSHAQAVVASAVADMPPFLARSRALARLMPLLTRLAASTVPVLIEGETGTGKDVLAQALHAHSPRASRPFVVFDCSAVAANVIESELFGHERGAFTGAVAQRKGLFEEADGGSLFLDEVGDLPLDLQGRLLRVIERSEVRRVGGNAWISADVRILSATRRDIDVYVQEGRFRDDLFHRLAIGRVELPPLRKRREEIEPLARHFLSQIDPDMRLPDALIDEWGGRAWPGNVRELRNAVLRYAALGEPIAGDEEDEERSSAAASSGGARDAIEDAIRMGLPLPRARARVLHAFEKEYVEAMVKAHGTVQKASRAAGVALRYFQIVRARSR